MKVLKSRVVLVCASLGLTSMIAGAETVTFEQLPGMALSANDMSPDGRYIVGETGTFPFVNGTYIMDTVTGVLTPLHGEGLAAVAVSDDGRFVVGCIPDPTGVGSEVASRWSAQTGWVSLGFLPNAGACPSRSNGYEMSADGSVVVGLSWDGCNGLGFRWTAATGMEPLEELANGSNRASVVSGDGTVIGGFAQGSFSRTPAVWDGNLSGVLLDPPSGDVLGEVQGISDDGEILLGEWNGDAFRWSASTGMEVIGQGQLIPGWQGIAMDIADNGTIVGFDFLQGNRRSWIQPNGTGPLIELVSYIQSHGGTVPAGAALEVCQAISTDGTTIIGHGYNVGAFKITIAFDEPCPADCAPDNGDGTYGNAVVNIDDLLATVNAFGATGGPCDSAPDNGDGTFG
ncbi:MAG: hypothetical protein KC983_10255, partial [Phycisphaerales bacterium]|nr:hypothetical protein [Phycisphaerales bacterium]